MALNLRKIVNDYLVENKGQKYTARQMALYILGKYPKECEEKKKASKAKVIVINSDEALVQQIVAEIGSQRPRLQKSNNNIKVTDSRPRLYYYTTSSDDEELIDTEKYEGIDSSFSYDKIKELDLYPMLAMYLSSDLGLFTKRIDEKKSSNTQGNKGNHWLFPDIVAMENLSSDWHREVTEAAKNSSDKLTRLWSFEVKISLNRSNIREAYFQSVSNSSWANFGYLVASEIGDSTLKELRILSGLHGIGFIKLDIENPPESSILIPAKEKQDVDWNTANRLAKENKDFVDFVKSVRQFYQTGDIKAADWDRLEI